MNEKSEIKVQADEPATKDKDALLFSAWSQYCLRPIPASLDSKGLYGLFPSYEAVLVCFQERSKGLGLGVFQRARAIEAVVFIETLITHQDGGIFSTGEVAIPVNANKQGERKPADFAASYSWAKRISLLIGCFTPSADPDDEGRPVQKIKTTSEPHLQLSPAPTAPIPTTPPAKSITEQFNEASSLQRAQVLYQQFLPQCQADKDRLEKLDALFEATKAKFLTGENIE